MTNRLRTLGLGAVAVALTAVMTGCSGGSDPAATTASGDGLTNYGVGFWEGQVGIDSSDADPTVPEQTASLVMSPYWDHSTEQIGIDQGWYAEVGLDVTSSVMAFDQIIPAVEAGQVDVGTAVPQSMTATLDQGSSAKVFTLRDIFMGHSILASPESGLKSVSELMTEGSSWEDAVSEALGALKGQTVEITNDVSSRLFRSISLEIAGMTQDDFTSDILDDDTIQQLALSGQADFVAPASGPNIVTLIGKGWIPLISTRDIVENGDASQLLTVVVNTGLVAKEDWLEANADAAMRFASVGYRILDFKESDPVAAAEIQIPFINSIAGTEFTVADAETLDESIDPFYTFDEQAEFFQDETAPFYWSNTIDATIAQNKTDGLIVGDFSASDVSVANDTWLTLNTMKEAADVLFTSLEASGGLSDKAAEQLAQAKTFYQARDYLDALRFANAADLNR